MGGKRDFAGGPPSDNNRTAGPTGPCDNLIPVARRSLYVIIAVLGAFLLTSKLAGNSFPMAATIQQADRLVVQWSTQARVTFYAIGVLFLVIAGVTAWRKLWPAVAVFGLFGLFILVIIHTMLLRSRIDLLPTRVEFRDRPRYFSDPLILPYDSITSYRRDVVSGDAQYSFELDGGSPIELGENPLLDMAWPIIVERVERAAE